MANYMKIRQGVIYLAFPILLGLFTSHPSGVTGQNQCPAEKDRIDCHPSPYPTLSGCESRRCVWCPPEGDNLLNAPKCVLPPSYGYQSDGSVIPTPNGFRLNLRRASNLTYFGGDSDLATLEVEYNSNYRLRVKISDGTPRYEVPLEINPLIGANNTNLLYTVELYNDPVFSFKILRRSTGTVIFDTSLGGLTFSDQFLQISTRLPSQNLYGIGENEQHSFKHDFTKYSNWALFSRDQPPEGNANMYGVHPYYTVLENDGNAHSVVFINSNAQEFVVLPTPGLTYRTIGGILDMYFFLGPTPENTVQQYTEAIGRTPIPTYWSLGFHLCRIGYNTLENMQAAVDRTAQYGIPQDVQYGDGDTKDRNLDFTVSQDRFQRLPEYVRELREKGIKYVTILNPFTTTAEPPGTYRPFELGNELDIWVKNPDGSPVRGKVWPPDAVYYPDYTKNSTLQWWITLISEFKQIIDFEGLWIDMNEPANLFKSDVGEYCQINKYNNPPYVPNIPGGYLPGQTICTDALDSVGRRQYDTHSLFGWFMSLPTVAAVEAVNPGKRAFVLTRSTFVGSGKWVAHWLGDNFSNWPNMRYSIIGTLQFNQFGIPFVGADICGFIGNTTSELCQRWLELGAFYPFARSHNGGAVEQDPGSWGAAVADSTRKAMLTRYTLLPYLYTLFFYHYTQGSTVARALWHEFPQDVRTRDIDQQFLWGPGLMISPVLEQGATTKSIYFPQARWFDYYTGLEVLNIGTGIIETLSAPLDYIHLHLRGGVIYPSQEPALNTELSRQNPFNLTVALDANNRAEGRLYYDDGDSLNPIATGRYYLARYVYENGSLTTHIEHDGYPTMNERIIQEIKILGYSSPLINNVASVNGEIVPVTRTMTGGIILNSLKLRMNSFAVIHFT